jgi:hypothetical protein
MTKWTVAEVHPGQLYESTDPRDGGRRVEVTEIFAGEVAVRNIRTGRTSYIRKQNLCSTLGNRGWRRVGR